MKLISKFKNPHGPITLPEVSVTAINPSHGKTKNLRNYIMAVNNMRPYLMKKFNFTDRDFSNISKFAVNNTMKESGFGRGFKYNFKESIPDSILRLGKAVTRGNDFVKLYNLPLSRGYTLIKFNLDILDPELKSLYNDAGLTNEKLLNDPINSAMATTLRAANIYKNKNIGKQVYTWDTGERVNPLDALMLSWQYGSINTPNGDGTMSKPRRHNSRKSYSKYEYDSKKIIK